MSDEELDMSEVMFEEEDGSLAVDLSNVEEDAGFAVVPKGTYNTVVDNAEYKVSKDKGNPMISLTLAIEDGEYKDRKLFTHVVFAPKTMGMAKRTINRLGLAHLLESKFIPEQVVDEFIGARCKAVVSIEKYNDEDTNRVKNILPAGAGNDFEEG